MIVRAPNTNHNGNTAGVQFVAGVGHTDRPAAIEYFRRAGYSVEPEGSVRPTPPPAPRQAPAEPVTPDPANPFAPGASTVEKPLERMNKAELTAIANELGADVEGTNRELIARIRAAQGA
jgi:hypothetical protein